MKCELCHQGEAETVIWLEDGQSRRELYVCAACAEKEKEKKERAEKEKAGKDPGKDGPEIVFGVGKMPDWCKDAIMGMIKKCMKGAVPDPGAPIPDEFAIEGRKEARREEEEMWEPSCPACGITRHEFRNSERLGCPVCYETFRDELEPEILEMHGFTEHRGKRPPPRGDGKKKAGGE